MYKFEEGKIYHIRWAEHMRGRNVEMSWHAIYQYVGLSSSRPHASKTKMHTLSSLVEYIEADASENSLKYLAPDKTGDFVIEEIPLSDLPLHLHGDSVYPAFFELLRGTNVSGKERA